MSVFFLRCKYGACCKRTCLTMSSRIYRCMGDEKIMDIIWHNSQWRDVRLGRIWIKALWILEVKPHVPLYVPAFRSPVKLPDSDSRFSSIFHKSKEIHKHPGFIWFPWLTPFPFALERWGSGLLNSDEMQVALLQLSSQTRPRHHSMPRRKQSGTMMTIQKGSSWRKPPTHRCWACWAYLSNSNCMKNRLQGVFL